MKSVFHYITYVTTALLISSDKLSFAKNIRSATELYDAFALLLRYSPTLMGYNFTEQDEALFSAGWKQQDVHLKIDEIFAKYGHRVERHEVTSEDGYVLVMFRIPGTGRPLLLMHGLMMSADDWVTAGPESALPYMLADAGFDMWLGNVRGTKHSRRHITLSPEVPAFWDFSWDEIGRYDLPAMINYVLHTTNHSSLLYVGHSQGTTSFFVLASENPEYNKKISLMVALAPAAAIPNMKSPFLQFINYATLLNAQNVFAILREFGLNELTQSNIIIERFARVVCGKSNISRALCTNTIFLFSGINHSQMNISTLPVVLSHLSSGGSVKQVQHYAQTVTSLRFQRFDYGAKKNKVLYGSRTPPEYNVGAITTPVALFYSSDDWLASEPDTKILRKKLNNVVDFYQVPEKDFKHTDFIYGKDVRRLIFKPMLKLIKSSEL